MTDFRDMTTGEADAWRAGWIAAREAAAKASAMEGVVAAGQIQEAEDDSPAMLYQQGRFECAERVTAAIRGMEPPA